MRGRRPNMWCRFPGLRPRGPIRAFWGGANRPKNLGMIAGETPPSGSHASASLPSNGGPDSRVERRPRRHAGVEESADPARCRGLRVLKFGGSSLATPDCIRAVGRIVGNTVDDAPAVIVVSAFQ